MPTVRTYNGVSLEPAGEVYGIESCEISFDFAPSDAQVSLPRTSSELAASRLMAGGTGAVWEIDARDVGAPQIWTGRVMGPQWSPGSAAVTVKLVGPMDDLSQEDVPAIKARMGAAGAVVRELLASRSVGPPIFPGTISLGPGAEITSEGQTLADLMGSLSGDRGESYYLTALPGRVAYILDWCTSPDRRDVTDGLGLVEGETCEPDMALNTSPLSSDIMGVAASMGAGTGLVGSVVAAPMGGVLGRRAALRADVTSALAEQIMGVARVDLRPDLPTRAAMEMALRARLQSTLAPVVAASCEITDTDLWFLRPGDLVTTRWPTEPTGLFRRAIARIRTTTYSVMPRLGMTASLELWAIEGQA